MGKIKRTIELFKVYYKTNIKEVAIYDKDFYFGIISMIIEYATSLMVLFFIFDVVEEINGWTFYEILFLYSFNLIGFSLWSCFFINTITLPYYIQDGSFDRFLLRPISPIFQIMMDGFDEDSWGELLTGIILFIYSWIKLKINIWLILVTPVFFVSACFIYAGISIMFSTLSFFTIAKADFANLTMEFKEFAKYPMSIYKKGLQMIFTTIVPIGFVAFYPSKIFFEGLKYSYLIIVIPIISYIYYKFSKYVWNIGLKRYGSSGS